jgi:ribonuclease R
MEIEIALRKHDLPFEFSKPAMQETKKLPDEVRKSDWKGRENLTELPLVTIDGETAKDFDDAVYCERKGKGFRLIVAIADVSHYVQAGGPLDQDAYDRGNSVYFPRRVIPMLPEKLSNGLCSLNPQVERLCMVCDMEIAGTGDVRDYRFYPAVMWSHARLTYTEVAAALYDKDETTRRKLGPLLPWLENLDALYRVLAKAREKRGAIDFETVETRMVFDDHGKIERIEPYERNDAHRLIEECMLAANVCASDFLRDRKQAALYRVHEGPTPEKLAKLRDFLGTFGLQLGGGEEPQAKDYAKLMEKIHDRPDKQLLQTVMLRSLRQAIYSPDNVGHFGLAYESYTHFTSPIRRYPDLTIHRLVEALLTKKKPRNDYDELVMLGRHCSDCEQRAETAERELTKLKLLAYLSHRLGEEMDAVVTGVENFGIFVQGIQLPAEGLIRVESLRDDYYHFDRTTHTLSGHREENTYRLGDRLRVAVAKVDLDRRELDFRLVERQAGKTTRSTKRTKTTKKEKKTTADGKKRKKRR